MVEHLRSADSKLMKMLCGYAAAHQHPFNVAVHLIGIPVIMFGAFIPLTWVTIEIDGIRFNLAHGVLFGLFLFYLTLDVIFAVAFLGIALPVAWIAAYIGSLPAAVAWTVSAATFFGGYALQFAGHAVERSAPVVLRYPIQANVAAPFFAVVEIFHLAGLRQSLFAAVKARLGKPARTAASD